MDNRNETLLNAAIQNAKVMEARYLRQLNSMSEVDDVNLIAKGSHNLTANTTMFYCKKKAEGMDLPEGSSYDTAIERLAMLAILPEVQEELRQMMGREKLLKDYEQDDLEGSIEYQRVTTSDEVFWATTRYSLFEEPESGDIVVFIYSYDITNRVLNSQIVAKLSSMEYDALGIVNVKTHQYMLKGILSDLEGPKVIGQGNFEERVIARLSKTLISTEKDQVIELFQIDNLVKQLEDKDVYFFSYSVEDNEHQIRRKKMQFTYLDQTKIMVLYCRSDITEVYQREQEQLRRTEEALLAAQEANRAKSSFLSRMSHDIRTPMNTIINLTRIVKEELDDKEAALEDLKKIETSNQFLLSLVNDILDMSRIEQRNIKLNPERYSYREFMNYIDSTFQPLCEEKDIYLQMEAKETDFEIMIDKVRFNQMCFNLLSNAIKYTPSGGHVCFRMLHSDMKEGKMPCDIYIIDDGIGMSKEFQRQMFEPFSQEGRAFKTVEGTGLGLSIVKEIVDLFNGTIEVQSEVNKGSTFHIHMDMQIVDLETSVSDNKALNLKVLQGRCVLLAEDHPMNQEIAQRLLASVGVSVHIANNGKEAVDEFEQHSDQYDAVLMDMRMPVMDGLQAAKAIRALNLPKAEKIPIIAMTANAFSEDRKETARAGMNEHLAKPIEPKLLYEVLAEWITKQL